MILTFLFHNQKTFDPIHSAPDPGGFAARIYLEAPTPDTSWGSDPDPVGVPPQIPFRRCVWGPSPLAPSGVWGRSPQRGLGRSPKVCLWAEPQAGFGAEPQRVSGGGAAGVLRAKPPASFLRRSRPGLGVEPPSNRKLSCFAIGGQICRRVNVILRNNFGTPSIVGYDCQPSRNQQKSLILTLLVSNTARRLRKCCETVIENSAGA